MSYSMLEAIFNGKVIPWERKTIPTPHRKELENKIEIDRLYFIQKMSIDDGKRFEELHDRFMELTYEEELDVYSHGFTLGSLMMMEVMEKKGEIINE